jgi:methyl-accepting chemotaxis protein
MALSIRLKLFVLSSAIVTGLVVFLVAYFASRQVRLIERTVVERGDFVAQQLKTAVAFGDKETAREVFEAAHNAPEVLHLALFGADGRLVYADGGALKAPAPVTEPRLESFDDRVRVVAPVVSIEGPRGALVVEIDRARMDAEIRAARMGAGQIGGGGLLIACLAAWLVGGSFARRLDRVKRGAVAVAAGDLGQGRIEGGARDEIGELAAAFNTMVDNLRTLVVKLSETSAQLEGASETFLDIVREQNEGAKKEGSAGMGEGLMPGFIELRHYAEDINKVVVGFKLTADEPAPGSGTS